LTTGLVNDGFQHVKRDHPSDSNHLFAKLRRMPILTAWRLSFAVPSSQPVFPTGQDSFHEVKCDGMLAIRELSEGERGSP
jgi:hypothetical protein